MLKQRSHPLIAQKMYIMIPTRCPAFFFVLVGVSKDTYTADNPVQRSSRNVMKLLTDMNTNSQWASG